MQPFNSLGMVSLSDFYSNYGHISHRFQDTPTYWLKIVQFSHPLVYVAPFRGEAVGVKQRPSVPKN